MTENANMRVDERFKTVFTRVMNLEANAAFDDMTIENFRHWDSLRHAELLIALQSEFGVRFKAADLGRMRSVRAIKDALNLALKTRG